MKVFLNIAIAIVIITLVALKILGIGFFKEEFLVDCNAVYSVENNENTVWIKDNCLFAKGFWHCKTEDSEKTYELIKLGYLKSASIGA